MFSTWDVNDCIGLPYAMDEKRAVLPEPHNPTKSTSRLVFRLFFHRKNITEKQFKNHTIRFEHNFFFLDIRYANDEVPKRRNLPTVTNRTREATNSSLVRKKSLLGVLAAFKAMLPTTVWMRWWVGKIGKIRKNTNGGNYWKVNVNVNAEREESERYQRLIRYQCSRVIDKAT